MDYGEAPESDKEVREWLARHERFGHFIGGKMVPGKAHFASLNPADGTELAKLAAGDGEMVDRAVSAARAAATGWAEIGGKARARFLYAMARHIQKHARFLGVLETLDNGKPIRETRDGDIPLAARHFYHHAGWAQIIDAELAEYEPHGVIGQIIPWNFPFLMLAWKIAPALAAGNTIVLKPAEYTSLSALFFAEICRDIGLPKGVVNIVTGDGETGAALVAHPDIDKIAFTGSSEVGREIQATTAPRALPLTLELGGKSPFIVFEDADLDAAVEGLVDAIWYNQGEVCCAGARLLAQAPIAGPLQDKIIARMNKLRVGNPLDKSIDIGALADQSQLDRVTRMVSEGLEAGGELFQPDCALPDRGWYYPPTLISDVEPAHSLFREEIFGPVLVATSFRTEKEAIALANNSRYGLAASIWSENLDQCLSVAPGIEAGVVWINSHNLFDAAAPFGGVKESGFGREGARRGMLEYLRPRAKGAKRVKIEAKSQPRQRSIDITRKFFIGGKGARPDGGYSRAILDSGERVIDQIGIGNRKDIRNAVEAARGASWARLGAYGRAQILYYLGENLERRAGEWVDHLAIVMGAGAARKEVETAIASCFDFAAWADKFAGSIGAVPIRAVALSSNEPVGVIAIIAGAGTPFATPMRALSAALSMGNHVVLIAPEDYPGPVLDIGSLAQHSDIPAGALNILAGNAGELGAELARHAGVDALWDFADIGKARALCASNIKRLFTGDPTTLPDQTLLEAATRAKTIWLPYGALY